ncbi:MAG: hypothetical protein IPH35_13375 [Rhodoferax sp.]|nr:hypothetical protein [Rhodoferax sp.]
MKSASSARGMCGGSYTNSSSNHAADSLKFHITHDIKNAKTALQNLLASLCGTSLATNQALNQPLAPMGYAGTATKSVAIIA